ncbi:bifunctional metallophosphatase/5'-nucleotidase [Aliivibrio finisterrensis]|uniref:Bifunctional metallophosphatase/5'-nucleotidase n=1 Tax=Aliivibrio finisterrensis TaxID=511998 RepID=A0A6N6RPY5_9GAMM|nr:bifunctional metallophosphatase/5'-nucleotidase [Aliivibrio finisterrensis]KAB2823567.1 bifunctional metallophosphatase/5'-nucleotidase [Aliivibrio finisterrensis]
MKNQKDHVLRVMHINDTHSYFDESVIALHSDVGEKYYIKCGGFARISHQVSLLTEEAKAKGGNTVFFHAGDCFQGTLYFSLYKGKANADLLNQLPLDGMVLGNHEFDLGNELVSDFIANTHFPILMGNWNLSQEDQTKGHQLKQQERILDFNPTLGIANYLIKKVGNLDVAVFGLTIDQMDVLASPDPDTPFMNAIKTAQNTVDYLAVQGITNVIIVSHLGYEGDKQLAKVVNGIDLIIGGHSHVLQGDFSNIGLEARDNYGELFNDTHIVQAGCHALALGYCDLEYSEDGELLSFNGRNILLLDNMTYKDKACTQKMDEPHLSKTLALINSFDLAEVCEKDLKIERLLIDKYRGEVDRLSQKVIGHCTEDLSHRRIPDDKGQSDIAPWVVESFYSKAHQLDNRVQFAMHNAGGVRSGLSQGDITYSDIAGKVLPFAIPIVIYSIKGRHLKAAIEGAIDNATDNGIIGSGSGSFPYVSQMRYCYEASKPSGQRITEFSIYHQDIGWAPILDEQVYFGTSTAYTIKGKEGYAPLLNKECECITTTFSMADCFIDYLSHYPNLAKPTACLNQYHKNKRVLV